jgi:hypothetical protein
MLVINTGLGLTLARRLEDLALINEVKAAIDNRGFAILFYYLRSHFSTQKIIMCGAEFHMN